VVVRRRLSSTRCSTAVLILSTASAAMKTDPFALITTAWMTTYTVDFRSVFPRTDKIHTFLVQAWINHGRKEPQSMSPETQSDPKSWRKIFTAYLTDEVNLVADSGRRLLRSAVDRTCVVPRTHNTYGDKSCSASELTALWRYISLIIIIFYTSVGVPEVGDKISTRNYNSNGQSSERLSAKLSCSRLALKRCIRTEIRWNR